jgi:hypothetical protein
MAVQTTSPLRYPLRAMADVGLMLLGILLATWPLVLAVILLKVVF